MDERTLQAPALGGSGAASRLDELAGRAAHGDRHAFTEIYDETAQDLFNYLLGCVRNSPVAEDLAATTYLKAWRSAKSYKVGSDSYRKWLFGIARNELNDHWRTRRVDLSLSDTDLTSTEVLSDLSEAAETREFVARAIGRLTPVQRDVVVLRYYGEKSHQEIAQLVGKREGAVRALLMRALRQLRKEIESAST